jgi:hypothetical protein
LTRWGNDASSRPYLSIGRRWHKLDIEQAKPMGANEMDAAPGDWSELWGTVGESLLGGLHHALNNRVAALSAISQVLGAGMPDSGPLVASLSGEVSRMEETIGLLSLLRRARTRRPEPVQVPELVAGLTPLLAQHNDLKEVVFVATSDPGVLPVWAERDLLTHVLLTLMVAVGIEAGRDGCRRVRISYRGDDAIVTTRVACERNPDTAAEPDVSVQRLDARGAGEPVQAMGGELETTMGAGGEAAYEVRLPTLLAARKAAAG